MPDSQTVKLTINGRSVQALAGQTVLQAATASGIEIPTLCHHPHLRASGSCRVCLVEIEKQRALQPACTFPVSEGLAVRTDSERIFEARKFSLEMLFSERSHYCMFCQASGSPQSSDCELQKLAYRHGLDCFKYAPAWNRDWPLDASRDYIAVDHSRCVLCRRCVRACDEVAAAHVLGVQQRGARTMISADDDQPMGASSCTGCGTCLEVCPTGAIGAKRNAFLGHRAECTRIRSTCMSCAVGCGIQALVRDNAVVAIESDWDGNSGGLLCAAGRFESLSSPAQRIRRPLVRLGDQLVESSWDEAISAAAKGLSVGSAAGFITSRTVNETMIAFVAFLNEVLKSDQVSLLHGQAPMDLSPRATLRDVADADCIVVIGGDPLKYQKVLGYLIKRSFDRAARLIIIDDGQTALDDLATQHLHLRAISHDSRSPFAMLRYTYHLGLDGISQLRKAVDEAQRPIIAYGPDLSSAVFATMRQLSGKVKFMPLVQGPNSAGAARYGIEPRQMEADALFVMAGDDMPNGQVLPPARFRVVQAAWQSAWTEAADVVLPSRVWHEKKGQTLNLEGSLRPVVQLTEPPEHIGADWMPLAMMSAVLGRPGLFASMTSVQGSL
jgi:formate dehydrogenase major subunit